MDPSFQILGRKWAAPIVFELLAGKRTFNSLLRAVPGTNSKTLAARIADLVEAGLIRKQTSRTGPRATGYVLTAKGKDFRRVVNEIAGFSIKWPTDTGG
jgi:DNA-binding HxlR family transcriptional regulator